MRKKRGGRGAITGHFILIVHRGKSFFTYRIGKAHARIGLSTGHESLHLDEATF